VTRPMKEGISRQELLKKGAIAFTVLVAGGILPINALGKKEKKLTKGTSSNIHYDEIFDVIVVGSGLAGSVAAMTAIEKGNKVLLVEKMDYIGGSSIKQPFYLSCPGSKEQKQKGIKDSPENMINDLQKVAENYGAPELVKNMVENSTRFYELIGKLGIKFEQLTELRGHSVARTLWLAEGGKRIIEKMHAYLNGKCEIRTRVKVDEVLMDESGRAVGVKVREQYVSTNQHDDDLINQSGIAKVYGAQKGVILANGGFAYDKAFIAGEATYFGGLSAISGSAHPGSTAGVLKSMILKGAHPVNTALYHLSYPLYERDFFYGLMVDAAGARLADEGSPNKFGRIAFKSKNKNGGKSPICIFDQTGFELISDKQRRDDALKSGILQKFDSIEQISHAYSIPMAILTETIAAYHKTIDAKKDEVTMKLVGELNGAAVKKAPFYVVKVDPELHYTTGGLRIDKQARVLKMADAKPFNGLFAAGEATGGILGAQLLEGVCALDCGTFGMIAGEQAAAMDVLKLN
jgi:flavocytochrome c